MSTSPVMKRSSSSCGSGLSLDAAKAGVAAASEAVADAVAPAPPVAPAA